MMLWLLSVCGVLRVAACLLETRPLDLSRNVSCFAVYADGVRPASIAFIGDKIDEERLALTVVGFADENSFRDVSDGVGYRFGQTHALISKLEKTYDSLTVVYNDTIAEDSTIVVSVPQAAIYCAYLPHHTGSAPEIRIRVVNSSGFSEYSLFHRYKCLLWEMVPHGLFVLWLWNFIRHSPAGKHMASQLLWSCVGPLLVLHVVSALLFNAQNWTSSSDRPSVMLEVSQELVWFTERLLGSLQSYLTLRWSMGYGIIYGPTSGPLKPLPSTYRTLTNTLLGTEVLLAVIAHLGSHVSPAYYDYIPSLVEPSSGDILEAVSVCQLALYIAWPMLSVYFFFKSRPVALSQASPSASTEKSFITTYVSRVSFLFFTAPFWVMCFSIFFYSLLLWADWSLEEPFRSQDLISIGSEVVLELAAQSPIYFSAAWIYYLSRPPRKAAGSNRSV